MWPLPFIMAFDAANEHIRDLELEADHARLAAIARAGAAGRHAAGPGIGRTAAVRGFRLLSDATHAVSEAACTAATRLEGKVA